MESSGIQVEVQHLARAAMGASPLPEGTSEREIRAFEARNVVVVPPELRSWLRFTNGPRIGMSGLLGIRTPDAFDDMETVYPPEWRKRGWIPIASDGCGSYFALATQESDAPGRPVFFMDHERRLEEWVQPTYVCASDLWHFLRFYIADGLGKPDWPFDRDRVLRDDPDLAAYTKVAKPWELD